MKSSIFAAVRRVTVFLLGVAIIVAGLIDPESDNTISMLIIGMIMVGVLPIDDLFLWFRRRPARPETPRNDERPTTR